MIKLLNTYQIDKSRSVLIYKKSKHKLYLMYHYISQNKKTDLDSTNLIQLLFQNGKYLGKDKFKIN